MIELGTLDRITVVVGERGVGKSTLARRDASAFQHETGGLVIGHSPNGAIGASPEIAFADSMRELERGLRRRPDLQWFLTRGDPEHLFDYAQALSLGLRKRAFKQAGAKFREHRPPPFPIDATPVLVVVDEGAYLKRHPDNEQTEEIERFLVSARHNHVALTYSIQAPTRRLWILMEQATRFRIFRYTHEWGANALRAAGIPQPVVPQLKELPNFVYYSADKRDLDAQGFVTLKGPA